MDSQGEAVIKNVLRGMWVGARLAEGIVVPERFGEDEVDSEFGEAWGRSIAAHLGETFDLDVHNCNSRITPKWRWFRSMSSKLSVFDVGEKADALRKIILRERQSHMMVQRGDSTAMQRIRSFTP